MHVVARLPAAERGAFKEPLGEIYETADPLLETYSSPIYAVGDVVVAHLAREDCVPALSIVDGRTERGDLDQWVREAQPERGATLTVENPAGTITAELVDAVETALERSEPVRIHVDGEEDLAVLPALLLAPAGGTVVYGQPGEGMVAVPIDAATRDRARVLLGKLEQDRDFWAARR
ncbi:MAG: GTP-dependent dephospho-CoA kinase family protein [Halodesulfurarchaeum sp.]